MSSSVGRYELESVAAGGGIEGSRRNRARTIRAVEQNCRDDNRVSRGEKKRTLWRPGSLVPKILGDLVLGGGNKRSPYIEREARAV
jgi:hypothetical protein